jgi:selenocysteine lyase/cysteine desulfurase
VAFLYVAQDRWDGTAPWLANWRSTTDPYGQYYGGPLNLASTAARFDVSLAWFAWAGAAESLKLLVDWQRGGLLQEVVSLARRLANGLGVPPPGGVVVGVPLEDAEAVRGDLAAAGIKAAVRSGSVRLSPHIYNTTEQIDRAASALARRVPEAARQ